MTTGESAASAPLLTMPTQAATSPTTAEGAPAQETNAGGATTGGAAQESNAPGGDVPDAKGAETGQDNKDGGPPASEGAPETYQFEAPEGLTLDADLQAEFEPFARKHNLTNAEANEAVALYAKGLQRQMQTLADGWTAEVNGWREAVAKDQELGGTPEQIGANLAPANLALERYGDAELGALMERFSLGNNPAFLRFCRKAGLPLQEDKSIARGAPPSPNRGKAAHEVLWPDGGNRQLPQAP